MSRDQMTSVAMGWAVWALMGGWEVSGGEAGWLASFEHEPGVEVRLFASEPEVVDPVALCFGADETCYVVEMRDYPLGSGGDGQAGGRVRRLRDRDGDGRADESVVFAEGLGFPTSIAAWRGGVLVAAPPEIIYLEDRDGDGVADERRVVVSGFPRGVTDANFNGLRWGVDGRLHGVNGGHGGRLTSPGRPEAGPVELGRLDFVMDADSGWVRTTVETGGGFGLAFDDWGHSFTAHNRDYLQQRLVAQRYVDRLPVSRWLGPFTVPIAREGLATRIFPLGEGATRVNHPEQAGYFSAGSGTCYVGSSVMGAGWGDSILTCDPASGLIHRDELSRERAVGVAISATVGGREFLASRDGGFRPTVVEHGPDGALWVCDMQREVIEHPDYIPGEVKKRLDLRAGDDRGRIYRLVPAAGLPAAGVNLAGAGVRAWVEALASPVWWRRETAQRLLVETRPDGVWDELRELAGDEGEPEGRVRALWVLRSWGRLDERAVLAAVSSASPGVRVNGLRLAEVHSGAAVESAVSAALADPVPWVRWQAALSSGVFPGQRKVDPLLELLVRDGGDPWLVKAVVIGLGGEAVTALERVLLGGGERPEAAALEPLARLAMSLGRSLSFLDRADPSEAVVAGLAAGAVGSHPAETLEVWSERLARWAGRLGESGRLGLLDLAGALGVEAPGVLAGELARAGELAHEVTRSEAERVRAVGWLARGAEAGRLVGLLHGATSGAIQQAVLAALRGSRDAALGVELMARWPQVNPAVRPALVDLLVDRREWHEAVIGALERGDVVFGELNLDLEQRRAFLNDGDRELRERARKFFDDHEYSNRQASVGEWLARLPERGDSRAGFRLFMERCQMCHGRGSLGNAVGPELLGLNHRSTEDLLSHIVDPNMAIHPNYVACTVVTTSGERHTGLLRDESADSVSVLLPLGSLVTVRRDQLASVTTLNRSLMPEGLDTGLLPEELKGLIEFLQSRE